MSAAPRSGIGNDDENAGAACTAGNATLPMLASPVKPKMPRDCEREAKGWGPC